MKITAIDTVIVQPRWVFRKVHTDEGLVGLGEPTPENRAHTIVIAVRELEPAPGIELDEAGVAARRGAPGRAVAASGAVPSRR